MADSVSGFEFHISISKKFRKLWDSLIGHVLTEHRVQCEMRTVGGVKPLLPIL